MRAPAGGALEDRLREGPLAPAQAERSGLSRISRSVRSVRTSFRSRRSCAHSSVSVPSGRWSGPHVHDVLSAILRTAVKWDHLVDNSAQGVDLPRLVTVRLKWALAVPQAANLLEALPALPKTLVGLALLTGVRRGELFALRWRDLDISRQCLIIREAVYEGTFSTPKTTAGLRTIPLSSLATKLVADLAAASSPDGSQRLDVWDSNRQAHLTEQRVAAVDSPSYGRGSPLSRGAG